MPKPKQPAKTELYYKRTKDGVEIRGDPADVKKLAWVDLITARLPKAGYIAAIFKIPFQEWLPAVCLYVQNLM